MTNVERQGVDGPDIVLQSRKDGDSGIRLGQYKAERHSIAICLETWAEYKVSDGSEGFQIPVGTASLIRILPAGQEEDGAGDRD